ncbi:Cytochrome P450 [Penicillium ucsense]|uniref:Cytochrome P450 n=1 Tax=Penicillium ucsense TaxID=2839758 RepID=A0A8J8WGU3_9EURO|nr:Cytochrome P450 [Penicillium ucsense]KAF7737589.1 Cytochrome P450 [Penicillium ucsense]
MSFFPFQALTGFSGRNRVLPPGPWGLPTLGKVKDMPRSGGQEWVHWAKHKELYELLNKRSAIYSSCPRMVFTNDLGTGSWTVALQGLTGAHRAYRKAIHPSFGSEAAISQFSSEVGAVILGAAYAGRYTAEPSNLDKLVHPSNEVMDIFAQSAKPGAWMVDLIPALKYVSTWFPEANLKRVARRWSAQTRALIDIPYAFSKLQIVNVETKPSYTIFSSCPVPPSRGLTWSLSPNGLLGHFMAAAQIQFLRRWTAFLSQWICTPDVQAKAHEEIERVIGSAKLPNLEDRSRLSSSYLIAVVKEILRWHPVAPLEMPHSSIKDDICGDYSIPRESIMLQNIWTMMHEPATYHDPLTYKPERFLPTKSQDGASEPDPHSIIFGFGRRVCAGRFLAGNTVFLTVAQTLAAFNIKNAIQDGVPASSPPRLTPGLISHPSPFLFTIKPRTPVHEALISSVEQEYM